MYFYLICLYLYTFHFIFPIPALSVCVVVQLVASQAASSYLSLSLGLEAESKVLAAPLALLSSQIINTNTQRHPATQIQVQFIADHKYKYTEKALSYVTRKIGYLTNILHKICLSPLLIPRETCR